MTPEPFRITGDLPGPGLTVIEASAGTGKTYTLTSLVVRYVAEGTPLDAILAVTFTRTATGELRDRIRERMVAVHRALSTSPDSSGDELVHLLAEGTEEDIAARVRHLADALADFDAATIATTHGFCQMVLHGLGSAGDTAPDAVLLEDPADLVAEVVDDLYLRWSFTRHGAPPFAPAVARKAALCAIGNPETVVFTYPSGDPPPPAAVLGRLAGAARAEVARRLLQDDALTYDELLSRLAGTLRDEVRGPEACRRLASRYRVVLVDEFQDTDPVQWTILQRAFGHPDSETRLVLIGDPKQAIYAFRGADVHAYLDAAASADRRYTLTDNWRTDQSLLDATAAFFSPLQFGHEGIPFRSVQAPPDRPLAALPGPAVRVRIVDDDQQGLQKTVSKGLLQKNALVDWVAADVAADISRLLTSGHRLPDGRGGTAPLQPRDVAVLTRTNPQAVSVRDALRAAGVPSVLAGSDSVFRSEASRAWVQLLEAIQEPTSRSRLVALALGPFIGMRAEEVASAGEETWEQLYDRVHAWAGLLATRGVAALHRAITAEEGLPGRILAEAGGERVLTDLGHVAQLLHAEASGGQLGASSLRTWLVARIKAVEDEQAEAEERSRRLDSDAAAVQVLTVHRAKGLEFPVVYCPYLWDGGQSEGGGSPVVFHDPDAGGVRTLDCGALERKGELKKLYDRHARIAEAEQRGEDLRLMYVAVTRARHQVVLWWGRSWRSGCSPLGRLLLCRDPVSGEVGPARYTEPEARLILPALQQIAARAGGLISVEAASAPTGRVASPTADTGADALLGLARFDRSLDLRWRRASYSSITAAAHGDPGPGAVGSEPEEPGISDEPAGPGAGAGPARAPDPAPVGTSGPQGRQDGGPPGPASPWAVLPGGADVGTFVHRILEVTDFAAPDLRSALAEAVAGAAGLGAPVVDSDALVTALGATLTTPLDPLLPGGSLSQVRRSDRLDELGFELPVAGGDRPTGSVRTGAIADLLDRHVLPGSPLAGYADRLRDPTLDSSLRGYLVGSLDLVFRNPGPDGEPRWYVADYKTNWLGPPGATLTAAHYTPSAMEAEMRHRHYPLQALLYTVALHRYLRWRQPGYRPETHLGGVLYLFVRGMAGPVTPTVDGSSCGVWSWSIQPDLVVALSDLMDAGSEEAA
ncbi:MAG TPA: UvrD-helicase domain-containing protein [Acidimicrobiales bacterium]|nr:UvrD-helicase domain-containing protein [Acidimicrobiales bacterium]